MLVYLFDGTLAGLLTAVFESYERKQRPVKVVPKESGLVGLMDEPLNIVSDRYKAERVWAGLKKNLKREWLSRCYAAFLGEETRGFQHLFDLMCYVFDHGGAVTGNYGNPHVLYIARLDRKVQREKHRMEAFVRFQKLADGVFYSVIEPDYNVLPLIASHFKNRYADQPWIIYDRKRKYGLKYDLDDVTEVEITFDSDNTKQPEKLPVHLLAEGELLYQTLWQEYFKSTNIQSRKNTKLHIRHIPKRYWRYLTEKEIQ